MERSARARRLLDWGPRSVLLVVGVWTGLVVMSVTSSLVFAAQDGREVDLARLAGQRAVDWYSCALFTPLFVWVARRYPIDRRSWRRALPTWSLLLLAATPLKFLVQYAALFVFLPDALPASLPRMVMAGGIMEVVAFGAMAGVILSVEYHDRWRERELQAEALQRQVAEAKLEALSTQLQPHFLFNTLQSISTLVHRDTAAADLMLRRLSELLRRTLHCGDQAELPLREELVTLDHYVAIQRIRFGDRLDVHVDCDGVGDALVPNLVLQPLVENAIHHGIARRAGGGRITITARGQAGTLVLAVQDEGSPRTSPGVPPSSNGIGLANTRARLETMFGAAASLEARDGTDGRFTVILRLPLRQAVPA